jgi:DNA-binding transcriptional ArsR family regulator
MTTELDVLNEISEKLNQLITLTRLANSKAIAEFKEEIKKDIVSLTVLSLADGTLSSSEIKQKVMEQTKVSDGTVKNRIAVLMEKGALTAVRRGKEIYYQNTGLFD